VALAKIVRRPLLGGGHGETITYLVTETVDPFVLTAGELDNLYLTLMLRMGLVGMAAFVWIFLRGMKRALRLVRVSEDDSTRQFAATFLVLYSAMLVYGMADATMIDTRLAFFHAVFLGFVGLLSNALPDEAVVEPTADASGVG
jgi:O-antigen ligase